MSKQQFEDLHVVALMLKNFRDEKPLLEGAVLFRGASLSDAASTDAQLHAYLLPQMAAAYTHNWDKKDSFINTYPIDRDNTRFYPATRLADHLKGEEVRSYTVQDLEKAIRPLIENLSTVSWGVTGSAQWEKRAADLERFIKATFYEAGVPSHTQGTPTKPGDRFIYSGGPKAETASEVINKLEQVTQANSGKVKETFAKERPNEISAELAQLAAKYPDAERAFKALQHAAKVDQKETIMAKHGDKPLDAFLDAARKEPPSQNQERLLKLAQGLAAGLQNPDPQAKARATAIVKQLGQLDPNSATVKEVGQKISAINQAHRSTSHAGANPPRVANSSSSVPGVPSNRPAPSMSRDRFR